MYLKHKLFNFKLFTNKTQLSHNYYTSNGYTKTIANRNSQFPVCYIFFINPLLGRLHSLLSNYNEGCLNYLSKQEVSHSRFKNR